MYKYMYILDVHAVYCSLISILHVYTLQAKNLKLYKEKEKDEEKMALKKVRTWCSQAIMLTFSSPCSV